MGKEVNGLRTSQNTVTYWRRERDACCYACLSALSLRGRRCLPVPGPPTGYLPTELKTSVWTLIDSDDSPDGIPHHLAVHDTKHFIICSSSPQPDRWGSLKNTTEWTIAIMNPWSKKDISKAAVIHGFENDDECVYKMYEIGPTPRICFDLLLNPGQFTTHNDCLSGALQEISGDTLRKMIRDIKGLKMDAVSDTLLLLKRAPKKLGESDAANWASTRVEPITLTVEEAFPSQFWKQTRAETLQLCRNLEDVEGTRRIAGLVIGSLAQSKLQNKIELALVPTIW